MVAWNSLNIWIVATAYLLILKTNFCILNFFIKRWTSFDNSGRKPSPNAGKMDWLVLNAALVLTFILTGNAEGIGFLLAAKSIFPFGELNKAQEIKTTEYVLIGTLASFTVAILIGFYSITDYKIGQIIRARV